MFLQAFGVARRILSRRIISQAPAAVPRWSWRSAGTRLLQLHSRRNLGDATATASRSFLRDHIPPAMVIAAWSTAGVGLWYMNKIVPRSKVDWVEAGAVSPVVRNQKDCACCWAMPAVGAVEAVHYLNTKQSISLSVQELIDCDKENDGCEGGFSKVALEYIKKNGLSSESSYPYMDRGTMSGCKRDKRVAARISGYKFVKATEDALEEAVAKQPVIVSLHYPNALHGYKGGIIDALPPTLPDSSKTGRHSVLIVGHGTANGVDYWRFKNSWGKAWGEGGFGRIRRNVADKRGVMGMFMEPAVYPVLNT